MGMASRLSHQSDLRPATADRGHSSRYYKSKKSYDQALSTLAATLPLVSGRRRSSLTHRDTRQISTAPRGRRGSRTIGRKYDIPTVNNSGTSWGWRTAFYYNSSITCFFCTNVPFKIEHKYLVTFGYFEILHMQMYYSAVQTSTCFV